MEKYNIAIKFHLLFLEGIATSKKLVMRPHLSSPLAFPILTITICSCYTIPYASFTFQTILHHPKEEGLLFPLLSDVKRFNVPRIANLKWASS